MRLLLIILACLTIPVYAAEKKVDTDEATCDKVAKATSVNPAKIVEEQKVAYDRCMQKCKQTHAPKKS